MRRANFTIGKFIQAKKKKEKNNRKCKEPNLQNQNINYRKTNLTMTWRVKLPLHPLNSEIIIDTPTLPTSENISLFGNRNRGILKHIPVLSVYLDLRNCTPAMLHQKPKEWPLTSSHKIYGHLKVRYTKGGTTHCIII